MFDRKERYAGETKYPLRRMVRLALDGVFSLSWAPLRLAVWLGFASTLISFLVAIVLIVAKLAGAFAIAGWGWIAIVVLFIGGVQLVCIGAVGEYIGRIYDEVKQRPLYIIARTSGL
jgi:dolichol-phosphate mannosyltransferase